MSKVRRSSSERREAEERRKAWQLKRWLEKNGDVALLGKCLSGIRERDLEAGKDVKRARVEKAVANIVRTEPRRKYQSYVLRVLVGRGYLRPNGTGYLMSESGAALGSEWLQRKRDAEARERQKKALRVERQKARELERANARALAATLTTVSPVVLEGAPA